MNIDKAISIINERVDNHFGSNHQIDIWNGLKISEIFGNKLQPGIINTHAVKYRDCNHDRYDGKDDETHTFVYQICDIDTGQTGFIKFFGEKTSKSHAFHWHDPIMVSRREVIVWDPVSR